MEEILLNIGSIVEVEHEEEIKQYLIIGKRVINIKTNRAWDYYSVRYPEGCIKDKDGLDNNGFYFNHPDINKIIHICNIQIEKKNEEDEE